MSAGSDGVFKGGREAPNLTLQGRLNSFKILGALIPNFTPRGEALEHCSLADYCSASGARSQPQKPNRSNSQKPDLPDRGESHRRHGAADLRDGGGRDDPDGTGFGRV